MLFLAAMAAMTAAFVSCEPDDNGSGNGGGNASKFEFREAYITLAEGATQRLSVIDDLNATDYVWSSSDTAVVTVDDRGVVTGVASGDAIVTVTSGERKAECQVHVAYWVETVSFPMACILDNPEEIGDTVIVSEKTGESNTYKIMSWTITFFSEGGYVDNSGHITGAAEQEWIDVKTHVLKDDQYFYSLGGYEIVEDGTTDIMVARGGFDEETYKTYSKAAAENDIAYASSGDASFASAIIEALDAMAPACYTPMYALSWDDNGPSGAGYYNFGYNDGTIMSGKFELDIHETLDYMYTVPYLELKAKCFDPTSWFGWVVGNEEAETIAELDLQWKEPYDVTYAHGEPTPEADAVKELKPIISIADFNRNYEALEGARETFKQLVRKNK